jgi:uncharacterized protein YcfL
LLAACQPPQSGPITTGYALDPTAPAVAESDPRARLILGQDVLRGRIRLDNPRFRKVGNFTQAAVQVVNQGQDRFELEYQLVWRDDDDFEVSSSPWRRITLAGYEQEGIQAIANRPEASQITVTVRFPDEVVR